MTLRQSRNSFLPSRSKKALSDRVEQLVDDCHDDSVGNVPQQTQLGLFELTQAMVYPDPDDSTRSDIPYTEGARLVWYSHSSEQYGDTTISPNVTLYYPAALRDSSGIPIGTPPLSAAMRCYAWHNPQSVRWEILTPPLNLVRIELTGTLMPGDTSVMAELIDSPDKPEITIDINTPEWPGIGRAGSSNYSHAGTLGYAIWSPVRSRWELVWLQAKLISEGKTDAAINVGASGVVSLWWKDYATGNLVDSGENVTALNWLGPNLGAAAKVIVSYDRHENRWVIVGM
jgi:hypothetical protein